MAGPSVLEGERLLLQFMGITQKTFLYEISCLANLQHPLG
jgi:hypothetical protein